jgi:plasmanylethanolamine desaturase
MAFEGRDKGSGVLPDYELPEHDEISLATRVYEALSIVAAVGLLAAHAVRIAWLPSHALWLPAAAVAGAVFADFISGLVDWAADTWGRETLPVIGRRLLRPFRVHHVNPDDFLRRGFLDVNGDVATVVVSLLLAAFALPTGTAWGVGAEVFVASF